MKKILKLIFFYEYRIREIVNYLLMSSERGIGWKLLRQYAYKESHIYISNEASARSAVFFPHPHNIVIGSGVMIGSNCTIYHDVTLGQNHNLYPKIGDFVILYAGSKIIGDITIEDNVIVGANSVVTKNVAKNTIVAGNPGVFIRERGVSDVDLY